MEQGWDGLSTALRRLFRQLLQSSTNEFPDAGILSLGEIPEGRPLLAHQAHRDLHLRLAVRLERPHVRLRESNAADGRRWRIKEHLFVASHYASPLLALLHAPSND